MKKIFGILAAVAMVAACNTSCSKSDDNGGGKVSRNNGEREWDFTYTGDKIEATGYSAFTITLGANGYASEYKDEWDTFTYTYDNNGYVTQVKKNGEVCANAVIEDGCITKWSKFEDRNEDGVAEECWKEHIYSNMKNVAGIHNIYVEKGAGRWLQELGFFGKPTKYLCESNGWDYSDTPSTLTYEFDEKNCVTKEIKSAADYVENYFYSWTPLE